ncbi:hypothetical protein DIPPA_21712 [Diplonema papillatum]|nr:hypothetical protein DIPPA_21712 [Diplonema papillatum]
MVNQRTTEPLNHNKRYKTVKKKSQKGRAESGCMGQSNFKDGEYVPVAISDPDLAKLQQQQQQQQQQQRVSLSPVITMSSPGVSPIRRGDGENESGSPTPMSTIGQRYMNLSPSPPPELQSNAPSTIRAGSVGEGKLKPSITSREKERSTGRQWKPGRVGLVALNKRVAFDIESPNVLSPSSSFAEYSHPSLSPDPSPPQMTRLHIGRSTGDREASTAPYCHTYVSPPQAQVHCETGGSNDHDHDTRSLSPTVTDVPAYEYRHGGDNQCASDTARSAADSQPTPPLACSPLATTRFVVASPKPDGPGADTTAAALCSQRLQLLMSSPSFRQKHAADLPGGGGFACAELSGRQDIELAEDREITALRLACIKDAHLVKLSDLRRT